MNGNWWPYLLPFALLVVIGAVRALRLLGSRGAQQEQLRRTLWRALRIAGARIRLDEVPPYDHLSKKVLWDASQPTVGMPGSTLRYHVELAFHEHGGVRAAALLVRSAQDGPAKKVRSLRVFPLPLKAVTAPARVAAGGAPPPLGGAGGAALLAWLPWIGVLAALALVAQLVLRVAATPAMLRRWSGGARSLPPRVLWRGWDGPVWRRVRLVHLEGSEREHAPGALFVLDAFALGLFGGVYVAPVRREAAGTLRELGIG